MRRLSLLVLVGAFLGLGAQKCPPPNPNPSPTPTPSPSPTSTPTPVPTPTPTATPTPSPSPPPTQGCALPALDDLGHPEAWHLQPPSRPFLTSTVNDAMAALSQCSVGDPCKATVQGVQVDLQTYLGAVEILLRQKGFCSGQDGATADQINVARTCPGVWETYHIYNTGGGGIVWAHVPSQPCVGGGGDPQGCPQVGGGSYRGNVLIDPQWCPQPAPSSTPTPPTPPTPTPGPSPTPSPTATPVPPPSDGCVGISHFDLKIEGPARVIVDATPRTIPFYEEGDPRKWPCEDKVVGVDPVDGLHGPRWTRLGIYCNGGDSGCFKLDGQPYKVVVNKPGTWTINACSNVFKSVCSSIDVVVP